MAKNPYLLEVLVARPKGSKKVGLKYLNQNQLERFFKEIDKSKNACDIFLFRLILFLGLRVQEAVNIRLVDINEDSFQIGIQAVKGGRARVYDINGKIWRRLKRWLRVRIIIDPKRKNTFLFPSKVYHDTHITPQTIKNNFKLYSKRAGLDQSFSVHSLRHSCGVLKAKANHNSIDIMLWLRHRSITSSQVYFEQAELEKQAEETAQLFESFL